MLSINNFFKILNTVKILVLCLIGTMIYLVYQSQQELNSKQELRYKSYLLADELRQSSDDLTKFARTYVVTGNPIYEKYYWNILAIRNGQMPRPLHYERIYWDLLAYTGEKPRADDKTIALHNLMQQLGFSTQEFDQLTASQRNSDELVSTETRAMNAVKGLFDDGKGNFTVKGAPDPVLAQRLMHDQDYHAFKGKIMQPIDRFLEMLDERTLADVKLYEEKMQRNLVILTALLLIAFMGVIGSYWMIRSKIVNPMMELSNYSHNMALGDFNHRLDTKANYEINMLQQAINKVREGMKAKADFVNAIGNGNLDYRFAALDEKDEMGVALLKMQANLKDIAAEEQKRHWSVQGLAKFDELLRHHDNLEVLCEQLITQLVKYVQANQGGIFLLHEPPKAEPYLELVACYAYERKKYLTKRIYIREGLLGQAFLEADTVHITEIPQHYVSITSGLGEATPHSLLIVPLKFNSSVKGVIELASFNTFQSHEIKFIEQLAENMASTLTRVQVNEQTRKLLQESQTQAEELRAHEEEMRQNMEELAAIQEEAQRKEKMYIERIAALEAQLNT